MSNDRVYLARPIQIQKGFWPSLGRFEEYKGEDRYAWAAAQAYDICEEMVTPAMRAEAKKRYFAVVYGAGSKTLKKLAAGVVAHDAAVKYWTQGYDEFIRYIPQSTAFAIIGETSRFNRTRIVLHKG